MKPIFENKEDFINYDETNQIISACFEYMAIHLKKKESEGKVASKIVKQVLRTHFKIGFLKEELDDVLKREIQELIAATGDGFK